ncbi:MAG: haloacid dehalogenase type II [Gemmatimonadales bacterium]
MSSTLVTRRTFLGTTAGVAVAAAALPRPALSVQRGSGREDFSAVRALVFDVFGTVVDWRSSVASEVEAVAKAKGVRVDGAAFADAWRAQYAPSMNRVRTGELPWTTLDELHRSSLDRLLPESGLAALSEPERVALNKAWHRLRPWSDAVQGLTRLKRRFIIAPLSNGNISLMTNMAKYAGLPWDCILGAELAKHYKPDPEVYQSAADFLDLLPSQVMMVAAHLGDLGAAKAVGLRTALVPRPDEYGHGPNSRKPDLVPDTSVDTTATDFVRLAMQLGG